MSTPDLSTAKDPDLRNALKAMLRAAELARKTAIQTDTCIIISHEGKLVRISAEELKSRDEGASNE